MGPQPARQCCGKLRFGSRIEPVEGHQLNNEERTGALLAICLNYPSIFRRYFMVDPSR
ncbi:MAG: hypothetical protein M3069_19940 [Chloroflexota bacterium]|nr:hypothetical protein [Chloroflexota bacterium]